MDEFMLFADARDELQRHGYDVGVVRSMTPGIWNLTAKKTGREISIRIHGGSNKGRVDRLAVKRACRQRSR